MKKAYYFLLAIFISAALTQSCKPGKGSMAAAREAFAKKEFFTAGENYKAVYSKTKNKDEKNEACFKTAECYRLSNDMKNAENWFRKTVKADPKNTEALMRLAQSLKANQKFTEAIVEFNNYKKLVPADVRAEEEIKGCEQALKWKNEKTRYVIENVKAINSKWSDFAPMWYKKISYFLPLTEKMVLVKPCMVGPATGIPIFIMLNLKLIKRILIILNMKFLCWPIKRI